MIVGVVVVSGVSALEGCWQRIPNQFISWVLVTKRRTSTSHLVTRVTVVRDVCCVVERSSAGQMSVGQRRRCGAF